MRRFQRRNCFSSILVIHIHSVGSPERIRNSRIHASGVTSRSSESSSMSEDFYVRYYIGHKGKFGHEFLEFELRPDGQVSGARSICMEVILHWMMGGAWQWGVGRVGWIQMWMLPRIGSLGGGWEFAVRKIEASCGLERDLKLWSQLSTLGIRFGSDHCYMWVLVKRSPGCKGIEGGDGWPQGGCVITEHRKRGNRQLCGLCRITCEREKS